MFVKPQVTVYTEVYHDANTWGGLHCHIMETVVVSVAEVLYRHNKQYTITQRVGLSDACLFHCGLSVIYPNDGLLLQLHPMHCWVMTVGPGDDMYNAALYHTNSCGLLCLVPSISNLGVHDKVDQQWIVAIEWSFHAPQNQLLCFNSAVLWTFQNYFVMHLCAAGACLPTHKQQFGA